MNKKLNRSSKTKQITRIMSTTLCVLPAAIVGATLGGIFGLAFGIFAGFLISQVLNPIVSKKIA